MWEKATRFLLWPRDLFKGGLPGTGVAFGTVRWLSPVCSTGVIDLAAQLEALVLGKLWMPLPPAAKGTACSQNVQAACCWAAPCASRGAESVLCPLASSEILGETQLVGAENLMGEVCSGSEGFCQG